MAEKQPIDISKKKVITLSSTAKTASKKPPKPMQPVKGGSTPQKAPAVNKTSDKPARNADGTLKAGGPSLNPSGRPRGSYQDYSYRTQAKIRALRNPARIQKDLDRLDAIIDSPESTPAEVAKALEIKIKLNGNYDPQETKDITKQETNRVYKGLTLEQINKLLEGTK